MNKTKSLPQLKIICQDFCNKYIRLRDQGKPCISCGQSEKVLQAGHYYPVQGYDGLRYDEFNISGECSGCNCFDEGHLIGYGENLLKRIGNEEFEALKNRAAELRKTAISFPDLKYLKRLNISKIKLKN